MSQTGPFKLLWGWIKSHWKSVLMQGILYAIPIALIVGSYMIFNKTNYGTFTPVSGQIKHWWSTMPNTIYGRKTDLLTVIGLGTGGGGSPWLVLTAFLYNLAAGISQWLFNINVYVVFGILMGAVLIGFLVLLRVKNGKLADKSYDMMLPAIFIGCIIQITYYFSSGYTHARGWYWVAEMVTLVVAGSLVLDAFFTWMDSWKIKFKIWPLITLLVAVLLLFSHLRTLTNLVPAKVAEENAENYLGEVRQVEFYTTPGSRIGMTGGGLIAYFIQDRTVVNLDGLINSKAYFDAMKSGTATQFLDAIPLDYVFGKPYALLESDPYDDIFKNRLVEIGFIRGYESFTLFKYVITP